jgi:hypothetical protein
MAHDDGVESLLPAVIASAATQSRARLGFSAQHCLVAQDAPAVTGQMANTAQLFRSDATFQSSALVWVGWGSVIPAE